MRDVIHAPVAVVVSARVEVMVHRRVPERAAQGAEKPAGVEAPKVANDSSHRNDCVAFPATVRRVASRHVVLEALAGDVGQADWANRRVVAHEDVAGELLGVPRRDVAGMALQKEACGGPVVALHGLVVSSVGRNQFFILHTST